MRSSPADVVIPVTAKDSIRVAAGVAVHEAGAADCRSDRQRVRLRFTRSVSVATTNQRVGEGSGFGRCHRSLPSWALVPLQAPLAVQGALEVHVTVALSPSVIESGETEIVRDAGGLEPPRRNCPRRSSPEVRRQGPTIKQANVP